MLVPGTLSGEEWGEAASLARAIEDAMIAGDVINLDDETPDAATQRRKTFIAIATGIVTHFKSNADLVVAAGALGTVGNVGQSLPSADVTLSGRVR